MQDIVTLDLSTACIQHLCRQDEQLGKLIRLVGPITYSRRSDLDSYRFLIHEIIEQMLAINVSNTIYSRLEELCGGLITPEVISALTDDGIRGIGTARSKVSYIRSVTNAVLTGELDFPALRALSDQEVFKKLTSVRGIGPWTAKMYLLFALDRPDVLPTEDAAFLQAYQWLYETNDRRTSSVSKRCECWKPYSSVAARYLYKARDMGLINSASIDAYIKRGE